MDLKKYPTITIVVPCFNVDHVVDRCVRALLEQDYPKDKLSIVFVDDKSTDSTLKSILRYESNPQIKIIKHFRNRGLAAARNSGINASKSQIVGLLDSDMVVNKDWTKTMVSSIWDDNIVACMGGIKLANSLTPNKLDKFLYNSKRGVLRHKENEPIPFKWFLFNNSAVKRDAIKKIGLFDDTITSYGGEDTDFAIRLWDKYPKGLRFANNAVGEHFHQRPLTELQEKMEHYGQTNYLRLLERYPAHIKDMAGDWINSIKGKIIFNSITKFLVNGIYILIPIPYLVRYFIAYSLMRGARNPAKEMPNIANNKGVT